MNHVSASAIAEYFGRFDVGLAAKQKEQRRIPLLYLITCLGKPVPVGAVQPLPSSFPRSAGAAVILPDGFEPPADRI